jgi:DNA-binding transcriptional MerR regulator
MRSINTATAFSTLPPFALNDAMRQPASQAQDSEWTISEVSRAFNLTLRALRFYESKGLISPRRFGGARYYTSRDRARLKLILAAKQMGFTLSETAQMIGRSGDGAIEELPLSTDAVRNQIQFLEGQRSAIEGALEQLKARLGEMRG